MKVRSASPEDVDGYYAVQSEEWGETMAATRAQLMSRVAVFPDGQLIGEHDNEIVAGMSFVRLSSYDPSDGSPWTLLTDDGWCTNHDPNGPVLFGVDLSVSRFAPRSASTSMFVAGLTLTMQLGVDALFWGSRLPRYHRYADQMSAEEYVNARNARGRYLDPEIELYSRVPGVDVVAVVSDYFKDWESDDRGAIFRWRNPIRRAPVLRPFAGQILGGIYVADRWRSRRRRR
ncbi:MAG: hypothetical protein AAF467_06275 [Actinomycetota bacterium]